MMSPSGTSPSITVPNRPFSTESITGLMLPDGIFEAALGNQRLNAHFSNGDANPVNVAIYVESVSDPRFVVVPQTYNVGLPGGTSHLLAWDVDISTAPAGVYQISFIAESATGRVRMIKKVFVTRVQFDPATKTFSAQTPEGIIEVRFNNFIEPEENPCCNGHRRSGCDGDKDEERGENFLNQISQQFKGHTTDFEACLPGYLLNNFEVVITPTPAFTGQYGDLPFQDPWWKVILCIIALILLVAASIVSGGKVSVTGGTNPPPPPGGTPNCCGIQAHGGSSNYVAAGLVAAAAAVATAAGLSDVRDPIRRGQDNTLPAAGETTTAEQLKASLSYPEPVAPGKPFAVNATWTYTRITTGASYNFSVTETNRNIHTLSHYKITAPNVVRVYREEPFIVQGEFFDQDERPFRGDQLFVQCILAGPQGQYRSFIMQDDGIYPDRATGDGVYTGRFFFTEQDYGLWMIYVIAQDVNNAQPDLAPEEAAAIIGGLVRTHQITITFEGGTCPLVPDGDVHVISSLGS